jgi:hypothetical protein
MPFKLTTLVAPVIIYLFLLFSLLQAGPILFLFVAYAAGCMFIARQMIAGTEARRTGSTVEFSQSNAVSVLGTQWSSFHHVFNSSKSVIEKLHENLTADLSSKLGCSALAPLNMTDVDADLARPETRMFFKSAAPETIRKTGFSFLCTFSRTKDIQGVRWWIVIRGERDPNKVFSRYAWSPLTIPFSVIPYLRRQYDPLSGLMTLYPGFFNAVDILGRAREIQFVAFETVVATLESFGIDTSDLKMQKGNILNINVSGGQTTFGSVIQGAMNKVTSSMGSGE